MNKKVTVVTERFYPDENSTSYFMTEITKTISDANGGNINVICVGDLNGVDELLFLKKNY